MASAYSLDQLSAYEEYVGLPLKYQHKSKPALDGSYLTALHVHQIAAMPYENLGLHYSASRYISLDPQVQFQKTVGDARGRGGYCMEGNLLYNEMLKAAGFSAYTAGVRIRPRADGVPGGMYTGWVHVVNIITLPTGEKFVSDVAFGGDGPTRPLPMIEGHVQRNLGTQEVRLIVANLPQQTRAYPQYWQYQYRNSVEQEWNSFYAFTEMEFFLNDFVGMNHYTSTFNGSSNFQTFVVLIVRFLKGRVDGEEDEQIVGKAMLVDGVVKRNDGAKTKVIKVCKTESDRLSALEEEFNIRLIQAEIDAIRGHPTELVGGVIVNGV